jgi:hypothetical protein
MQKKCGVLLAETKKRITFAQYLLTNRLLKVRSERKRQNLFL